MPTSIETKAEFIKEAKRDPLGVVAAELFVTARDLGAWLAQHGAPVDGVAMVQALALALARVIVECSSDSVTVADNVAKSLPGLVERLAVAVAKHEAARGATIN